MNYKAIKL